jgi:hypothetical protein
LVVAAFATMANSQKNLATRAESGEAISFAAVVKLRFDASAAKQFDELRTWTERPTPRELEINFERLSNAADGKPRWKPREVCWQAKNKSLVRAMIAAAQAPTAVAARNAWEKVERAYANAETLQRIKLRDARIAALTRPTQVGKELAPRIALDQAWREAQFSETYDDTARTAITWRFWNKLCQIDNDNTRFLKTVIGQGSWPMISRDGKEAAEEAWLIAQHADGDPDFQEQVLRVIEPLVSKKEADGKNYALLFDRVALARNRPQRYATQFTRTAAGCLAASPTEDPKAVDARRVSVGLKPISEYTKALADAYKIKACDRIF